MMELAKRLELDSIMNSKIKDNGLVRDIEYFTKRTNMSLKTYTDVLNLLNEISQSDFEIYWDLLDDLGIPLELKDKEEIVAFLKKEYDATITRLYSYSGFSDIELVNVEDLFLESNYLGDVTDIFMEEYNCIMEEYSLEDMIENQPLAHYGIWINPTIEQLQEYNRSVGLDDNDYIADYNNSIDQ